MKRVFFSLFLAFATFFTTVSAQEESEHLVFKGVPIDGTLNEYVSKMKEAGFTHIGTKDGMALLQGDFAGFKNCMIGVSTLKAVNIVSMIGVIFPSHNDWSSLENDYDHLKSMLTQKYGEPTDVVEQFQGKVSPSTNNEKLHELYMDRCTWQTTFGTTKGDIQLSLQKGDMGEYFVLLKYYDKANTDTVRSAAIDDL
ncbi:MAG TPA: hypothetical protein H9973_07505 [Candidatus Alistipes cottocaccae]|nr:hypothetical protein [Candidatus Alistipes cottocaccae]